MVLPKDDACPVPCSGRGNRIVHMKGDGRERVSKALCI